MFSKTDISKAKCELDLSIYVTKADLENAAGADTLDFAKETDLANSKSDVDKLDIVPSKIRYYTK